LAAPAGIKVDEERSMSVAEPRIDSTTFYDDVQRVRALSGVAKQAIQCGGSVLDLASGPGRLSIPLARAGIEVVGLDASPKMLALAEQKLFPA
jgi:2-polyprenyl-3-methyl-5-hydroxy-6-metoxy-1,4-benzoquinol methylase